MAALLKVQSGSKVKLFGNTKMLNTVNWFQTDIYNYTTNANITGMQFGFNSGTDVAIVNETRTLQQTIVSDQPFNITL
jgi:hypothetical protein